MIAEAGHNGWLPQAPTNLRYSPVMVAQHEIAMITGAWQKGVRDFDAPAAMQAVKKSLLQQGEPMTCGGKFPQGFAGNRHVGPFLKYGFVPEETGAASTTFEYSFDEACGAVLARALGKTEDAKLMEKASANWRNAISPTTGWAQRRHADGNWVEPADIHQFGTSGGWNGLVVRSPGCRWFGEADR
jgi:putative alpha-1,2-mannosidase